MLVPKASMMNWSEKRAVANMQHFFCNVVFMEKKMLLFNINTDKISSVGVSHVLYVTNTKFKLHDLS